MNSKYSMVIPTYNRPVLLKKLISFLSHKQVSFPIFVLDSSIKEEDKRDNKHICANSNLKIAYFDYPSETTGGYKVLDGLKKVDTEYVSFCADDDIVFPEAIENCLDFLVNNTEYVGCHGYYLNFEKLEENEYKIFLEYKSPSIDGNSFPERFLQLMSQYEAVFYAVFKTNVLKSVFNQVIDIDGSMFPELFRGLAPLVEGKIKRLQGIYYSRCASPPHELAQRTKWHPYQWLADNPEELIEEYLIYRDTLLNYIKNSGHDLKDIEKYKKLINLVHATYFVNTTEAEKAHFGNIIRTEWNIQAPQLTLMKTMKRYVGFFSGKYALEKSFRFNKPDGVPVFYRVKYTVLKKTGRAELKRILKEMTVYFGADSVK